MIKKFYLSAITLMVSTLITGCPAQTGNVPIKSQTFRIDGNTEYVNVMDDSMPAIPQFPTVARKVGYVRGYVKDTLGQPIIGAKLGLKSARIYDSYLANSAESDASGYYEIKIPTGGARFDYSGFCIKYGGGIAPLSLHPADGNLSESYPSATGGVENFVMLPYGIADTAKMGENPRYPSNYYGGTLMLKYIILEDGMSPSDAPGWLAKGSEIVINLTPLGALSDGNNFARAFEIHKKVKESSAEEFYICNVPIGRYDLTVKQVNGKPFRLRQINPSSGVFGMQPMQTSGRASLLFNPFNTEAKGAMPGYGNWSAVEILVELQ